MTLFAFLFLAAPLPPQPALPEILARVSEEAEVLRQNAPKSLTRETLEQRAVMPPSRFRPRIGQAAVEIPKSRLRVREVVSEYTVSPLRQSDSSDLVEFRQVISVDGRPLQSVESAIRALASEVQAPDDRFRKRMLEEFAKNGLVDVATDYGLILLAFSKRGLEHMDITPAGEGRVGVDDALILAWKQTSAAGGVLEFNGKEAERLALQGKLWVRRSDGLPLRVDAWAEHSQAKRMVRDEATVDYVLSSHGFLTPASVVHRHLVGGEPITENLYRYEPFKLFTADAEIKFPDAAEPDSPKPAVKK